METSILTAHSYVRYVVLLAAAVATLYALFGLIARRPFDRAALTLLRVFVGVLDLQVVLGIVTLILRPFYPALMGHIVLMVAAAAVAHLGAVRLRKLPATDRRYASFLATTLIPLVLIIGGILAIQRAII